MHQTTQNDKQLCLVNLLQMEYRIASKVPRETSSSLVAFVSYLSLLIICKSMIAITKDIVSVINRKLPPVNTIMMTMVQKS